jgi:cell division transport system ATP-binding protein
MAALAGMPRTLSNGRPGPVYSPPAGTAKGMSWIVSLVGVTKVYPPKVVALADVNLHLDRGEFVFLIGASGAGKSTLIRLLYREERATSGRIMVHGHDLMRMPAAQVPFLRRRIGVVFQDFKLLPRKTVAQNIAFPLIVSEVSPREIRRRVGELLEIVGLRDRAHALPAELSGGEQQRAALARAVINNPVLLIADEPTGNLDPETSRGITQLLADINRRGTTCVVATHSEQMVNALRRRVVAIDGGRVVRDEHGAIYRDEEAARAADLERRWAMAAGSNGPRATVAWPSRGARR